MMKKRIIALVLIICVCVGTMFTGQVVSAEKMRGDVNLDESIDVKDSLLLKKYLALLIGNDTVNEKQADCNNDGEINATDALDLINYLIKNGSLHVDVPGGWENLYNWEGLADGVSPSAVTTARGFFGTFKTKSLKYYSVKNEISDNSQIAMALVSNGLSKGTGGSMNEEGSNPVAGISPSTMQLDQSKLANATNLRLLINMKPAAEELPVVYIGFILNNGKKYYHPVTLESYKDFGYFHLTGKTYTEFKLRARRTYLDNPNTYVLKPEDIKEIKYLYFWMESNKGSAGSPFIVDDIDYFVPGEEVQNDGADAYEATLPKPSEPVNDGKKKYLCISFDDGPRYYTDSTNAANNGFYMDKYMDVADEYNAKFSFFLIGDQLGAEDIPTLKRAVNEGHELANHTWSHPRLTGLDATAMKKQITDVDDWLKTNVGVTTTLLRPPYLAMNSTTYETVDMTCIGGFCPEDYNLTSVDYRMLYYKTKLSDCAIVLVHEHYIDNVETVKRMLEHFSALGYEFVTISDLFEIKGITPEHNKMYEFVK